MAEDGFFELVAGEAGEGFGVGPTEFLACVFEQAFGNDIDVPVNLYGEVLEFRMEGDGHVGRDGPRGGGPDQAIEGLTGESGLQRGSGANGPGGSLDRS